MIQIDKKSLQKCMKALESEGLLHIYETTVLCDGAQNKVDCFGKLNLWKAVQIQCICHRDVASVDEPIVKEYIESTIDQYHKEGRVFPHGQLRFDFFIHILSFHYPIWNPCMLSRYLSHTS